MINKVNVTQLRQFLCFYCLLKSITRLSHYSFLTSLLFRIVSSLDHIHLPLFVITKVNVTLLCQFLGLHCLSKLIISFTHDVFLISLIFSIISRLNNNHLPLFMIKKVNVALLRQFLFFYCLFKSIIRLIHYGFLTSLLFTIVSSLDHIHLPLFLINKVNVTLLRQFQGLYCLSKVIIWFSHNVFLISVLFKIVSSLNHIHLPLFMINKVNDTFFGQFLSLYCVFKVIILLSHDVFLTSLLFRIISTLKHIHLPRFMINNVNVRSFTEL